ncbi:hypothetical protein IPA_05975 [Ignicoccus pacificus DSM 13166]|uniref:Uncharacterized protein n=1 Tax=Ignicoccus pacificus DSM 13166 TaxID=940294 RepID=A0A977KBG7_9CREN|nr:hypothetical protein IPA_05975 [Ignicoccus pacificus DSM 13166]
MVFGVTPLELLVLILSDSGYTVKEIAKLLDVDVDMMNDIVEDLVDKGYVNVKRRWKLFGSDLYLELTPQGKKALRDVARVLRDVVNTVKGMVDKGNIDGARAFLSRYVEYLPYAPLLGVAEKDFIDTVMQKLGIVPTYAPPDSVYNELLKGSEEWWEEEL